MQITLLSVLDYAGVATFAASGALMAAQKRQDVVTFMFFAAITGVGGGTLRDLLIGAPVFWVLDPGYVIVCTVVAVLVFLTRGRGVHEGGLLWLDAVGLCVYAVVGAGKALALGVHPVICVVMGVLTATFGGIIRDVLAGEPSILLRRELYITPAMITAAVFVVLRTLGVELVWASAIAIVAGFIVRAGAILWKWHMPAFQPPKPKDR
ncbi:MAG: trimeric intracellular cation channel family protein [Alphaproteobacteria bacterium]|nr:MAG: trimeric intracellular cation channel family protein [Alphaproteobacteria bacterium]